MMPNWEENPHFLVQMLKKSVSNDEGNPTGISLPEIRNPNNIRFLHQINGNTIIIRIKLGRCAIGLAVSEEETTKQPLNMQENAAAFEAWALIFRSHRPTGHDIHVCLDIDDNALPLPFQSEKDIILGRTPHFYRFLYRVMKFTEQYKWFSVESDTLSHAVSQFKLFLSNRRFSNNAPTGPACNIPGNIEGQVEAFLGSNGEDGANHLLTLTAAKGISIGSVYRQLPVGLFQGDAPNADNSVFTANHSAIDLWSLSAGGNRIVLYELKANNKMVGIITELMFYANYMYDMFVSHNSFTPVKPDLKLDLEKARGYPLLLSAKHLQGIYAFMLADKLHPLVGSRVLAEMNSGVLNNKITYGCIEYPKEIKSLASSSQPQSAHGGRHGS